VAPGSVLPCARLYRRADVVARTFPGTVNPPTRFVAQSEAGAAHVRNLYSAPDLGRRLLGKLLQSIGFY
ncbi:MAG TPA: hypothetical protein PLY75_14425, partial [Gammaproteobacteria bacterium]|nr:hypothetical protein [Gammaproteobacteria bacterium]